MKRWEARDSGLLVPGRCEIGIHLGVTMLLMGGGGGANDQSLLGIITAAGLTSGLQICLDLGDAASYPGSGTTVSDRSGNGNHFSFGAAGAAPTWSGGTAGGLSAAEYLSFDGGDVLNIAAGSNPASVETLHKNNAAWAYIAGIRTPGSFPGNDAIFGTGNNVSTNNRGITVATGTGAGKMGVQIANGSGGVLSKYPDAALATGTDMIIGTSLNEATGAGGGFHWGNGAYRQVSSADTFDSTYSSPSSSAAAYAMQIGAGGNSGTPMSSGFRLYFFALWTGVALSKANMDAIYGASPAVGLRARFGI